MHVSLPFKKSYFQLKRRRRDSKCFLSTRLDDIFKSVSVDALVFLPFLSIAHEI
jgi:hypothetical protein